MHTNYNNTKKSTRQLNRKNLFKEYLYISLSLFAYYSSTFLSSDVKQICHRVKVGANRQTHRNYKFLCHQANTPHYSSRLRSSICSFVFMTYFALYKYIYIKKIFYDHWSWTHIKESARVFLCINIVSNII